MKNGVNVGKLWNDLFEALKRQIAELKKEAIEPIRDAIEDIRPGKIPALKGIFKQIRGAGSLEELERLRDLAIDTIQRMMEAQIEAARRISEARIAELQAEHDAQVEQIQKQKTGIARLFQLRQQQLNEEVQRIKTMRDVATSLKVAARDLDLSNVSPLKPLQRLSEARLKFNQDVIKARAGDIEAAKRLPQLAQQLLAEARIVFASSPQFTAIFEMVQQTLRSVGTELNREARIAELQLEKLNDLETIEEEIARLTKELGLTGKESLQDLKDLEDMFDSLLQWLDDNLAAQIKQEQEALQARILEFQNLAVTRLKQLQEAVEKKFDQLIDALLNPSTPVLQPLSIPSGSISPTLSRLTQNPPLSPLIPSSFQTGFSVDAFANALSEALGQRQPQMISIPIQVVTADGEVIADTVITRLTTETANGKIIINALGSGSTGLF